MALAKTALNRNREGRHPCIVPDFGGNALSSTLCSMILAMGLLHIFFYYVDMYSPGLTRFCQSSFGIYVMGYIY